MRRPKMNLEALVQKAAESIRGTRTLVAFSGAGMSAESGIPTFRDPGGIWDRFDPEEIGTGPGLLNALTRIPDKIRELINDTIHTFSGASPNPGHLALSTLEAMGILRSIITQNVDNLHGEAGNTRVIEIHGNLYRHRCLACGLKNTFAKTDLFTRVLDALQQIRTLELSAIMRLLPQCRCGSPMRPDVVMFGEAVQGLPEAFHEAETCEVMLVLGTSGVVFPASTLPERAKSAGAKVIEINPGLSSYRGIADILIQAKTGEALPLIVQRLQNA
jgi:NAD-dependent deacetylase